MAVYSAFYRRGFAIAAVLLLGIALYKILTPFWGALGWAAVLAFLLHPLHVRLTRRFKGRAGRSAGLLTALTPFVVIAPIALLGLAFAQQVAKLIEYLKDRRLPTVSGVFAQLERVPGLGRVIAWIRSEAEVTADQLQDWLITGAQSVLKTAATAGGNVMLGVAGTLVGFFLMLFLLFFLLRDGQAMLRHVINLIPMNPTSRNELVQYLADVTRAVIFGSALTAVLQGALVGVGFAIAGLPAPVVFGVLGMLAAFIPAAGTGLVLVPGVIALALMGEWGSAIFLAAWTAVVGVSDNILRPLLTAQTGDVSTLAVFVGAIGGVSAFGFIGLIIGPVLLSLIVALIRFAEKTLPKTEGSA
jgi:predicted PurR-regulated permease PerM